MNRSGVKGGMIVVTSIGLMCLMALSMAAPAASAATEPSWNYAFPMGGARSQATVVQADNGIVYVIGGFATTAVTTTTLNSAYNPSTGEWTALAPLPVATRGACGGIGSDGRIYVFDGITSGTQIFNITTNSWSAGTPEPAAGYIWEGKSAINGDKAYVFGGEIGGGTYVNQTAIYTMTNDSWSSGADMPYGVKAGAVVADNEYAYYFGGANVSGLATTNASRYNFATDTWSIIAPLPSAMCAEGAAIGPDGLIYVFGGADRALNTGMGAAYSETYTYDRGSNTWATVDDMNMERAWLGAAVSDNKILAIGGNTPSTVYSSVESLDTLQNQLENLQDQLAQANSDISSLESENALLKAQLVELSAKLNQTNAALEDASNTLNDAESAVNTANMIGMIAVVLAVVAIVVAVVAIVLKKKS